ncbi:nitrilase-related carbon-nitrogen hydrolase [Sandaracinobacteroides saxicola]|uniref:CN hydrolase domain-containing protein n=1 Tax=Sandaracinobacteroides saxicola TaxID=2759707 RepID=A0A7G5IJ96_9SPHN|nr:nitrilase-related carbon-nitrogen hydrolase [Sandaracinobacteroides saxicola]QMW23438.1 hypothetical protein H3309_02735 [Sandaracinobacteroides saxicola]
MDKSLAEISRRALFHTGALGVAGLAAVPAMAAMGKGPDTTTLIPDGTYATVPLAQDSVSLGICQTRVRPIDAASPEKGRAENLAHMLDLIDAAQAYGGRRDILFFHEFPLTGWSYEWGRKEALRVAIDVDGPEVAAIGKKAKQYNCMIVFGSYAKEPAWPNHLLSITFIIGPDGRILDKHWKARNIKGVFVGFELFTTTIHDVLDRYVEMYGWDAVVPVTRTPLGNLCTSSTQREFEYIRAMAMKGGEIILRTASGGFSDLDIAASAFYNGVYVAICNNSISPGIGKFFEAAGGGGSALYGPDGKVVQMAETQAEELVGATIPIRAFRARHRQPNVHTDLILKEYEAYRSRHPANLFATYLPTDGQDAKRFLADKSRWK